MWSHIVYLVLGWHSNARPTGANIRLLTPVSDQRCLRLGIGKSESTHCGQQQSVVWKLVFPTITNLRFELSHLVTGWNLTPTRSLYRFFNTLNRFTSDRRSDTFNSMSNSRASLTRSNSPTTLWIFCISIAYVVVSPKSPACSGALRLIVRVF